MNDFISENKLIASIVLVVIVWSARWLIVRHLSQRPSGEDELPRRWINSIKNATNLLIAIGLIIIWLSELRFVALSIAAFAVALVVATREFIQCFLGSLYQASNRTFVVGDWIRVGSNNGEVVRSDWFSTVLLEIDLETMTYGYTGRTLIIPNNQFISNTIQNLNFMRRYVAHSFAIVRDADPVNFFDARDFILERAKEYCMPFQDVAHRYSVLIDKRLGVNLSGSEASVRITSTNLGKNMLTVTVFCPTKEAVNIEQRITADFMAFWYAEVEKIKAQKDKKSHTQEKNLVAAEAE
ncbi:mechanosensitive ion channel family protein [Photobacterium sp.]|uniref:mechanosensitive ion channel family protein n=1 Tax=Photobacterium sp. TaxID=660 RepID=UPI00299E2988|nr:mechanosensitive ion channel family protein [Photobacterium sp.]MDX1302059.1 mechanosensitive ion channel family protein [Photobacterium sp.]